MAQVFEPDLATGVAPMPHEQTRLHRDEAEGVVGMHGHGLSAVATQPLARLRVQPGGHVDGQHIGCALLHGLHANLQSGAQGPRGADAQQRVDAQVLRVQMRKPFGGHPRLNVHACLLSSLQGRLGIFRAGAV